MSEEKLGPMPEPEVESAPENPGGVDAINTDPPFAGDQRGPYTRDLHPDNNPEVEDHVPDQIRHPDDKQQEATGDGASEPEKEEPA